MMQEILNIKSILNQTEIKSIYFAKIDMLGYVNDIIANNCMLISMINDLLDYS